MAPCPTIRTSLPADKSALTTFSIKSPVRAYSSSKLSPSSTASYADGFSKNVFIGLPGILVESYIPSYTPKLISLSLSSYIIGIFLPFRKISAVSFALDKGEQ